MVTLMSEEDGWSLGELGPAVKHQDQGLDHQPCLPAAGSPRSGSQGCFPQEPSLIQSAALLPCARMAFLCLWEWGQGSGIFLFL